MPNTLFFLLHSIAKWKRSLESTFVLLVKTPRSNSGKYFLVSFLVWQFEFSSTTDSVDASQKVKSSITCSGFEHAVIKNKRNSNIIAVQKHWDDIQKLQYSIQIISDEIVSIECLYNTALQQVIETTRF